ncbi:UDP-glucose dehydrogenase family protein [Shouchella patagoniensis]|uniref:UDP-glucose dehydrogenase family protein n=1 Tax=Shouchella patagoniensis TaxID=228576 RepID=UPI000994F986|nr:UDP-glucose/GDP-mannose dehydrogenase family protein [Shouchella patagoniensis]
MNVSVIGTGYVGLVSGVCFSELGHHVHCVDQDKAKVKQLQNGKVPIYEPNLEELMKKNMGEGRLCFTEHLSVGISKADAIIIAVGTPANEDGSANLTFIQQVAKEIGEHIRPGMVIITKSTVPVGTNKQIKQWIAEICGHELFSIASCPEFLREGSAINDTLHMERAVFGVEDAHAEQILRELHASLNTSIVVTNLETAETAKYAANAFLATKISFINEVANVCEKVGADVSALAKVMGLDPRIGPSFLQAGAGYGGSCFPKDTQAFIRVGKQAGYDMQIIPAVEKVNKQQRGHLFNKVKMALGESLNKKQVAILGLAFKPNTDDMRAAPALDLVESLQKEKIEVIAFDPVASEQAKHHLPELKLANSWQEAVIGADAVLILTDWDEFKEMNLIKLRELMHQPVVVDGRNLFEPKEMEGAGFYYDPVGRQKVDGRLKALKKWENFSLDVHSSAH